MALPWQVLIVVSIVGLGFFATFAQIASLRLLRRQVAIVPSTSVSAPTTAEFVRSPIALPSIESQPAQLIAESAPTQERIFVDLAPYELVAPFETEIWPHARKAVERFLGKWYRVAGEVFSGVSTRFIGVEGGSLYRASNRQSTPHGTHHPAF